MFHAPWVTAVQPVDAFASLTPAPNIKAKARAAPIATLHPRLPIAMIILQEALKPRRCLVGGRILDLRLKVCNPTSHCAALRSRNRERAAHPCMKAGLARRWQELSRREGSRLRRTGSR